MKYLLRVLFILALFCAFSSVARADGVDFHVQVLDPNACSHNPGEIAKCEVADPSVPFTLVPLDAPTCGVLVPPQGTDPSQDGCLIIINTSLTLTITSFELSFDATGPLAGKTFDCPVPTTPPFLTCAPSTDGSSDDFFFSGGDIPPGGEFGIFESGLPAADFVGVGTIDPTPEPDSLLLLSTGAMMMTAGLYANKRRRLAFVKKNV
jgi:hypothetical protein